MEKNMVSLKKNQTISLKKESSALNQLHFGLGWDPVRRNNQAKKGFLSNLFSSQADSIDLDASCIMVQNGNSELLVKGLLVVYQHWHHNMVLLFKLMIIYMANSCIN